jgi:oligopeptide/dipeptide ABC transporter ATP-binding protein
MRLLSPTGGSLFYRDIDVFNSPKDEQRELYRKMQIIFQDPYSSLNPKKTIRSILNEPFLVQKVGATPRERETAILQLCERVGIASNLLDYYPHELDGGTRQVVGIARALSLSADFIVCDEPVSSLDVSVQAKIINMLMNLKKELKLSYLFISHDLSVVRHISDRVAVMYLGQIVEMATTKVMFSDTLHPYSIALLSAVPQVNLGKKVERIVLKGDVPSPINPEVRCRFAPRCWMAEEKCMKEAPSLVEVSPGHQVACFFTEKSRGLSQTTAKKSLHDKEGDQQ